MKNTSQQNKPSASQLPALASDGLRVLPLGGLGAIGRNMTSFEHKGKLLLVDCGVLFPEDDEPGIDLILPDFSPIMDRLDDVHALVLTHGHEDHIGAVPYLLRLRPDIPIVGSRFTLALITAKLREHRITPKTIEVAEEEVHEFGEFTCEFFAVNHSIPDALAVGIRTSAGTVLHTGDFKMDQLPLDGRLTDLGGFARLGREGIDLLMADSTNAAVPGFVTPEREIGPVLNEIFRTSKQRVVVASFASHVHRVQQVLDAARAHHRKVAFVGRSMVRNMAIAEKLGVLEVPEGTLVTMDEATSLASHQVVFMSTGSQGEPMSALGRMARKNHRQIDIEPGDTVVLASSLVPGNETSVFGLINALSKLGAHVIHKEVAKVHVSGHSPAGELLYLLNATRPSNMMPIHGEWRHLQAHAELAQQTGVHPDRVILASNGDVIDLVDGAASIVGSYPNRRVYVDGVSVDEVGDAALSERRTLGQEGFISVTAVIDGASGKILSGPYLTGRGFADENSTVADAQEDVAEALRAAIADGVRDTQKLQQAMRRAVGQWVATTHRRKPMIVPLVLEA